MPTRPSKSKRSKPALGLREMTPDDVGALCELAQRIWRAHYPAIISSEQTEYMLEHYYGEQAVAEQVRRGEPLHILAEQGGRLVGFITKRRLKPRSWFIDRFYVDTKRQGKGIGNALLAHVEQSLPQGSKLRLNVNRYNIESINYYFRRGFTIESVVDTPYGPYVLEDYVMAKAYK